MASWNTGAQRIKGYTRAEILGAALQRLFPRGRSARGQARPAAGASAGRGPVRGRGLAPAQGRQSVLGQRRHHRAPRSLRRAARLREDHARPHREARRRGARPRARPGRGGGRPGRPGCQGARSPPASPRPAGQPAHRRGHRGRVRERRLGAAGSLRACAGGAPGGAARAGLAAPARRRAAAGGQPRHRGAHRDHDPRADGADSPLGALVTEPAPALASTLEGTPGMAWAAAIGLGAFAAYPMVSSGAAVGVLVIYAQSRCRWMRSRAWVAPPTSSSIASSGSAPRPRCASRAISSS